MSNFYNIMENIKIRKNYLQIADCGNFLLCNNVIAVNWVKCYVFLEIQMIVIDLKMYESTKI